MKENKLISMAMFKAGKREICCGERGLQGVRLPLQPTTPHWEIPQWLSGPSLPLSVTAGPPVGYRTRFKWCLDAQYFYSTISIDDINAQSGWSLKTEKIRINNMYTLHIFIWYGIYSWHELAYTLYYIQLNSTESYAALPLIFFNFDLHC